MLIDIHDTVWHCNTLQHSITHCNTLQHSATHCNILQQPVRGTDRRSATLYHTVHLEKRVVTVTDSETLGGASAHDPEISYVY